MHVLNIVESVFAEKLDPWARLGIYSRLAFFYMFTEISFGFCVAQLAESS